VDQLFVYLDLALNYLAGLIDKIGYFGIFIGMFLEASFVPIPSEIIIVPAGILVAEGIMKMYLVILSGTLGSLFGSLFNYFLAISLGRSILFKIGKYFFIKTTTIIKIEEYFEKHGEISTFIGRLIPVLRQYISLPAGIARMNLKKFCLYTTLGSAIWVTILAYLGFLIGDNRDLLKEYLGLIVLLCLVLCAIAAIVYVYLHKKKSS
jgi:membrane protein DedA with SNARE-associated domain